MENKNNLVGKWGGIPIKGIKNGEYNKYIYPDDIDIIKDLEQPIVEIIGINEGYVIAKSSGYTFRISPIIVQESKKPDFFINDKVKFHNSKGYLEFGIIKDLYWHTNNNKFIYLIEVNGKLKSRRYFAEDLEKDIS